MATNENLIPIPGRLHSVATEGHVAGADEIFDDTLNKDQATLNADSAYLGDDDGQAVIPGFDPQTDTLHKAAQVLTTAEKDQVAQNLNNRPATNGMARIELKATDNFKSVVEAQTGGNTVFVIKYDFTLTGNVTVPANCVLEFDGGSISGDGVNKNTIIGQGTSLISTITKIFSNVKLDGSWNVECMYLEYWGVEPNNSSADSANSSIISNYVIPSLDKIKVTLKTIKGKKYYYNSPIVIGGNYSFISDGTLCYTGQITATALTIGTIAGGVEHNTYKINLGQEELITPYYTLEGSVYNIPENYGLVCYNMARCNLIIDSVFGFAKSVTLIADGAHKAFVNNTIEINEIGLYDYYCLKMIARNGGWANENLFINGFFHPVSENPLYKKQNYAIWLEGDISGPYSINNNVFIKPSLEGYYCGVKLEKARENLFVGARLEDTVNSMLVGNTETYSYSNAIIAAELEKEERIGKNVIMGYSSLSPMVKLKEINLFKVEKSQYEWLTNGIVYDQWTIPPYGTAAGFYGLKVKSDKQKCFRFECPPSTIECLLFDANGDVITSNLQNYLKYYEGRIDNGAIYSNSQVTSDMTVTVTDEVKWVFFGMQNSVGTVSLYGEKYENDIVIDNSPVLEVGFIPIDQTGVLVGEKIWLTSQNKYIYWNGTAWVDATGASV